MTRSVRSLFSVLLAPLLATAALAQAPGAGLGTAARVLNQDAAGRPTWVEGQLGTLTVLGSGPAQQGAATVAFLADYARRHLAATGAERFEATRVRTDEEGRLHVRLRQTIAGLEVVGADLVLHADVKTGKVTGLHGRFAPDTQLPRQPQLTGEEALLEASFGALIFSGEALERPTLSYVRGGDDQIYLAWSAPIRSFDPEHGERVERVFADALSGKLVALHPLTHDARNRRVYTANGGTSLPGTLLISEGGSSTDSVAQTAYNHLGTTWSYYFYKLGRDSYNGAGAQIKLTVRYGNTDQLRNNARWTGSQIWCGSGDGYTFTHLCNALDVTAHEFTHAVTQFESNLVYNNEPGALNESVSDMAGAAAEWYGDGQVVSADTWKVGEDITTPSIPGDAARYMNNPTQDFQSKDWYPERIPYTSTPNSGNDYGGVHLNSGIPNLVFYLLANGGSHPRGKTTISVAPIGIEAANLIFYRINRDYLTTSSTFIDAKNAAVSFASGYWGAGSSQVTAIQNAWCAVGLPGCLSTWMSTSPYPSTCSETTVTSTATNYLAGSCSGTCTYNWQYSWSEPNYGWSGWYFLGSTPTVTVGMGSWMEAIQLQVTTTCNTNCGTLTGYDLNTIWGPQSFFCGGGPLF